MVDLFGIQRETNRTPTLGADSYFENFHGVQLPHIWACKVSVAIGLAPGHDP